MFEMNIVVNGKVHKISSTSVTYREIALLASPGISESAQPTITWRALDGRSGEMVKGSSITLCEKMIFNAVTTNRA